MADISKLKDYKLALEAVSDGIWDWNIVTGEVKLSPGFYSMLGYEENEFESSYEEWKTMVHPDDFPFVNQVLNDVLKRKEDIYQVEFRMLRKESTWHWVLARGKVVLWNESGEPLRMIGSHVDIDSYKHLQYELEENEKRLTTLMDNLPGMVYRCRFDSDYTMLYISDGCKELTGYPKTDLIRNNKISYNDLVHPKDQDAVWNAVINAVENDKPFEMEYRIKTGNDEVKWVWEHGVGVKDAYHKLLFLEGFITDISEKKKAQISITNREAQLKAIYKNIRDAILIHFINDDGTRTNFIEVNKAACDLLGYSREELLSMSIKDIDNQVQSEQAINQDVLVDEHSSLFMERLHQRKDGTLIPVEIHASGFRYMGKNAVLSFVRDITERKKAENLIKESLRRQRILTDVSYMFNTQSDIGYAINQTLRRIGEAFDVDRTYIFEYSKDKKFTSNTYEWCKEGIEPQIDNLQEKPTSIIPSWDPLLEKNGIIVSDNIDELPDDILEILKPQHISSIVVLPVIAYADRVGFFGIDICGKHHKWQQSEIDIFKTVANILSAAYEKNINKEQLIEAKQKAEESDKLKSAFLANMSHEIRTPLNGILGFANLLTATELTDDKVGKYKDVIEKSSEQLLRIINDILDISRIETGQVELNEEDVDLNAMLTEVCNKYMPEAKRKALEFKCQRQDVEHVSYYRIDRYKFQQVLENLVQNAIKFTDEGSVLFGFEKEDGKLRFFVRDTGIGIPEKEQPKIFRRFHQVIDERNRIRPVGGTGLGLSISKAYVELMGGRIWVESNYNEGSVFYFDVPARRIQPQSKKTETNSLQDLKNVKILVAEDEESNYMYLEEILDAYQIDIYRAKNGQEALTILKKHPDVAFVLMDIKMPVMNGLEATKEIKKQYPGIPVIAQTAYATPEDIKKAKMAGCDDYLVKPIEKHKLLEIMRHYFKIDEP